MDRSVLEYFADELKSKSDNYGYPYYKYVFFSKFVRIDVCEDVYDALENKGYLDSDGDKEFISDYFFDDYDR